MLAFQVEGGLKSHNLIAEATKDDVKKWVGAPRLLVIKREMVSGWKGASSSERNFLQILIVHFVLLAKHFLPFSSYDERGDNEDPDEISDVY